VSTDNEPFRVSQPRWKRTPGGGRSPAERKAIAQKAAARWGKKK
jgi:hypothetical protein